MTRTRSWRFYKDILAFSFFMVEAGIKRIKKEVINLKQGAVTSWETALIRRNEVDATKAIKPGLLNCFFFQSSNRIFIQEKYCSQNFLFRQLWLINRN